MPITFGPYYPASVADEGTGWNPDDATRLALSDSLTIDWDTTEPSPVILKIFAFNGGVTSGMWVVSVRIDSVVVTQVDFEPLECAISLDGTTTPSTAWQTLTTVTTFTVACSAEQANNASFTLLVRVPIGAQMNGTRTIDQLSVTFSATTGDEMGMDYFTAARAGGWEPLLTEAIPSISSSAAIFANAPTGTKLVEIDIRSQGVYFNFTGGAASSTAGSGMLYAAGLVHRLPLNRARAVAAKAIQAAATATGTITYWGTEE